MKRSKWKTYALWIALTEAVGALAGVLTREGTQRYADAITKPPLSPPGIVFPIVWVILYALMGISAARVSLTPPGDARDRGLLLFGTQLAFNFFWSFLFFHFQRFGFALLWLLAMWVQIVWMMRSFAKVDRAAAQLQIPYLIWVSFAAYLNYGVWLLN